MAYKVTVAKACANREAFLAELFSQITAMGWTLVDGSCTPVTVAYTAVSVADDTFTSVGHTFVNSQPVQLQTTGTAPTGLAKNTQYFIAGVSGNTFKLSATYNGAAINITGQGTGNHTITESFRIYSSAGEDGLKIVEFLQIKWWESDTNVRFIVAHVYNATTKAIAGAVYYTSYVLVTTNQTGFYAWIHGDKDLVHIFIKISTAYSYVLFGHMMSYHPARAILSSPAVAGSNVLITVDTTAEFDAGFTYQIVSSNQEGRDNVIVNAINSPTTMTITTLPRNFAANSVIGNRPSTLCIGKTNVIYTCDSWGVAGIADNSGISSSSLSGMLLGTDTDPDGRLQKYVLQSLYYAAETRFDSNTIGSGVYSNGNILQVYPTGLIIEDTLTMGRLDLGTSSGSNDGTTLKDTSKSWTVNGYANKVLIITFGTGVGQIKKIASNTATALTLAAGYTFETVPDNTSQYVICNEGWRYCGDSTGTYLQAVCREGL